MSKMRERYHQLVAERSKLKEESDRLVEARSQALIDGTTFTEGDKIRTLNDEIIAIDSAIATANEQAKVEERREQAALQAKALRRGVQQVQHLCDEQMTELANAQAALEEATRSLLKINKLSEDVNRIVGPYSGTSMASIHVFDLQNVGYRMSLRILHTLSLLGANGYGALLWSPRPQNAPEQNWAREDRSLIDGALTYPLGQIKKKAEALEAEARGEDLVE